MTRVLVSLACMLACPAAIGRVQLEFAGGTTHDTNFESTYGWELDYAAALSEHSYAMLAWLNEGHQENNHRDGLIAQVWAHTDLLDRKISLAAGIGPYAYFDTVRDEAHPFYSPYTNKHGLTLVYSAGLTYYMGERWLTYLRANRLEAEGGTSTMLLLGFGYQFGIHRDAGSESAAPSPAVEHMDNEVTLYLGRTSLNSFVSEGSTAYALEYRRSLSRHVDWTAGWLGEGDNDIISRSGFTSQLWLVKPLRDDRLILGIGAGAYVAIHQQDQTFTVMHHQVSGAPSDGDDDRVSGLVSVMVSYRFDSHWFTRFSFNRVVTRYDRDADLILVGAGYRF